MKIGNFDTDSKALKNRLDLQEKLGYFDLNQWIFSKLNPEKGSACLDLGCGQGNQSLPLAKLIGARGSVDSVDISEESIQILREKAQQLNINNRIKTIHSKLDDIELYLNNKQFDYIVASYSLYYVHDANRMFLTIEKHLKADGRLFFCGPSNRNNSELRRIISNITGDRSILKNTVASKFMEHSSQKICSKLFHDIEVFSFKNPINFPNPESVISYWRSHNLFIENYDSLFVNEILKYFDKYGQFTNTKYGIGICCKKSNY